MTDPSSPASEPSLAAPAILIASCLASFAACGAVFAAGYRLFAVTGGTISLSISAACASVIIGVVAGIVWGRRQAQRSLALRQVALAGLIAVAPLVFALVRGVYLFLWPLLGGRAGGAWILRGLLGAGLFLLPAFAFGLVLSAASAVLNGEARDGSIGPGFVQSLATAGFGLGLVIGGQALMPALGLRGTWYVGMALAGVAAGASLLIGRSPLSGPSGAVPSEESTGRGGHWATATAAGMAGLSLTTAYIGWDRTVGMVAGPTAANALLTLSLLFLGLALGSFLSIVLPRSSGSTPALLSLAGAGLAIQGSMYVVPKLSTTYLRLAPDYVPGGGGAWLAALVAALLIAPAAALVGLALARLPMRTAAGQDVSASLESIAASAGGALVSAPIAMLVLVPGFGLRRTVSLAAAIAVLGALTLAGEAPARSGGARGTWMVALLALMVVVGGFPASWDPRIVAGGLYRYAARAPERLGSTDAWLQGRLRAEAPYFYREGSEACVVVERSVQSLPGMPDVETWTLSLDGRTTASNGADLRSQVLSAEIPMLLHGPTDKVLVIDFMTGVTAGSVLRHPVTSLRVIEREPAVLAAGALFRELANAPLDDARLAAIDDDPRAHLLADRTRYGVIILSGIDPWLPHTGDLVTREGYALLRERLQEGGLLAQRVSLSSAPEGATRAMLRTFARTFASVGVFQLTPDDLLVVGSDKPVRLDAGNIRSIVAGNPAVAADIRRVVAVGPNEVFMTLRLGDDALRRLLGDGPINDDNRAVVTVASARDLSVHRGDALVTDIDGAWSGFGTLLTNSGGTQAERAEFLYTLAKSYLGISADPTRARDLAKELAGMGETARARWVTGEALLQQKDLDGAVREWEAVLALEPDNLDALFSLGTFYLDSRDYFAADRYLARAAHGPHETPAVLYHYGRNLVQLGKYSQAIEVLRRAREVGAAHESYPLVDYLVGLSDLKLHKNAEAVQSLKDYLDWAYQQSTLTRVEVDAHLKLAEALEGTGKRFDALKERRKAEELKQRIEAYARSQEGAATDAPKPPATGPGPAAPAHGG
ncbi:MAG TPA: CDC27 family protein [Patescibacteria group bacterium]|nr:CDC27 family protein [Patescibacteria group bacterium]